MIHEPQTENPAFLSEQIITYIGNKLLLIGKIEVEVQKIAGELGREKLFFADFFSVSGIVARI